MAWHNLASLCGHREIRRRPLRVPTLARAGQLVAGKQVPSGSPVIGRVASLLGYQATPGYAAYAASKAYVLLFGEALHAELHQYGIGVTLLSPGATSTSYGLGVNLACSWTGGPNAPLF